MNYIIVLSMTASIFFILLVISLYFNYKHGILLIRLQDSIEASLDMLDERYSSMSKVLDMPIFFDSVEVRSVISDIRKSRDTILDVANLMTVIDETQETLEEYLEDNG